jgi:hypothetical protein
MVKNINISSEIDVKPVTEGREGEGGKECTSSGAREGIELTGSHIKRAAIWFRFFSFTNFFFFFPLFLNVAS